MHAPLGVVCSTDDIEYFAYDQAEDTFCSTDDSLVFQNIRDICQQLRLDFRDWETIFCVHGLPIWALTQPKAARYADIVSEVRNYLDIAGLPNIPKHITFGKLLRNDRLVAFDARKPFRTLDIHDIFPPTVNESDNSTFTHGEEIFLDWTKYSMRYPCLILKPGQSRKTMEMFFLRMQLTPQDYTFFISDNRISQANQLLERYMQHVRGEAIIFHSKRKVATSIDPQQEEDAVKRRDVAGKAIAGTGAREDRTTFSPVSEGDLRCCLILDKTHRDVITLNNLSRLKTVSRLIAEILRRIHDSRVVVFLDEGDVAWKNFCKVMGDIDPALMKNRLVPVIVTATIPANARDDFWATLPQGLEVMDTQYDLSRYKSLRDMNWVKSAFEPVADINADISQMTSEMFQIHFTSSDDQRTYMFVPTAVRKEKHSELAEHLRATRFQTSDPRMPVVKIHAVVNNGAGYQLYCFDETRRRPPMVFQKSLPILCRNAGGCDRPMCGCHVKTEEDAMVEIFDRFVAPNGPEHALANVAHLCADRGTSQHGSRLPFTHCILSQRLIEEMLNGRFKRPDMDRMKTDLYQEVVRLAACFDMPQQPLIVYNDERIKTFVLSKENTAKELGGHIPNSDFFNRELNAVHVRDSFQQIQKQVIADQASGSREGAAYVPEFDHQYDPMVFHLGDEWCTVVVSKEDMRTAVETLEQWMLQVGNDDLMLSGKMKKLKSEYRKGIVEYIFLGPDGSEIGKHGPVARKVHASRKKVYKVQVRLDAKVIIFSQAVPLNAEVEAVTEDGGEGLSDSMENVLLSFFDVPGGRRTIELKNHPDPELRRVWQMLRGKYHDAYMNKLRKLQKLERVGHGRYLTVSK